MGRLFLYVIASTFSVFSIFVSANIATAKDRIFRDRDDTVCNTALQVDDYGQEKVGAFEKIGAYKCMQATYALPNAKELDVTNSYKVSFLEFGGKKPSLLAPAQLSALKQTLKTPGNKYVLVFIHGWHHNANVGDRDVQRMHVFLAYARSFMNQRPQYRNTELVGVYIGWDGAVRASGYKWPGDHLSYGSKKRLSDSLASPVTATLKQIESELNLKTGSSNADKMLVVGHSFGGNILAAGLKNTILNQLEDHKSGQRIDPPLGDLTVMINPASEARNFVEIQQAIRERNLKFPPSQPPGFMAITSTKDWHREELCPGLKQPQRCDVKPDYDKATGDTFNIGQRFFFGHRDRLDTVALGHLQPSKDYPFGSTHDFTAIQSNFERTRYSNAVKAESSACLPAQAWLPRLRAGGMNWDTLDDRQLGSGVIDQTKRTKYQLRSYLMRQSTPIIRSAQINNEPYWNVRALSNIIPEHGDFMSYTFMCMINQFVLDDIGGVRTGNMSASR